MQWIEEKLTKGLLFMRSTLENSELVYFTELRTCKSTGSKSLHAAVELMPGQILSTFRARKVLSHPNYLTVQISNDRHIMLDPERLQYINHSCDPNTFFDTSKQVVRILRQIEIGEELTFFYPSTEWDMAQGFDCLCGSNNCLKKIQGAAHVSANILTQYQLSSYIQDKVRSLAISC